MPVLWNLDAIHRNQLVVTALLLAFCPWPFITMFYVILLASWVNEWEEEKIAVTLEDHLDFYLTAFGYTPKLVSEILAEQCKFINIDIQGGMTDAEVARGVKGLRDIQKDIAAAEAEGTSAFYEWWNEWFEGITKERYEILLQAMDFAREDWDTMTPIRIPPNELAIESLDFWYGYLIIRERRHFRSELTNFRRGQSKVFRHIKRNVFSLWYIRAHLDYWLDANSGNQSKSFFDLIEGDITQKELRIGKPPRWSKKNILSKEDRIRLHGHGKVIPQELE